MGLELYLYGAAYLLSGWFTDDDGEVGVDRLASEVAHAGPASHQSQKGQSFAA